MSDEKDAQESIPAPDTASEETAAQETAAPETAAPENVTPETAVPAVEAPSTGEVEGTAAGAPANPLVETAEAEAPVTFFVFFLKLRRVFKDLIISTTGRGGQDNNTLVQSHFQK